VLQVRPLALQLEQPLSSWQVVLPLQPLGVQHCTPWR
jgi:hypothetical protein